MQNFDIEVIIEKLKKQRQAFFSEADFQLAMALIIKEEYPDSMVKLEYVPKFNQQMHIDILVIQDNKWIPIELKYKTKKCQILVDNDEYNLKEHSAKDQNCYRYLKDIQRIEEIKQNEKCFEKGYAIFLTNDEGYKKKPRSNSNYEAFSLENGIEKMGSLDWSKKTSAGTKKGCEDKINLKQKYKIEWKDFSSVNTTEPSGQTKFSYIINEIKKDLE